MELPEIVFVNDYELEDETPQLIIEIEDFIDSVSYFIAYVSEVIDFKNLPLSTKELATKVLLDAIDIREAYQAALGETLEDRAEDICDEMDEFEKMMETNEELMDTCLVYIDTIPKIRMQFGISVYIISRSGRC